MTRSLCEATSVFVVAAALALSTTVVPAEASKPRPSDSCTMAEPSTHATVEAEIANADDFCELLSSALAGVFRASVLVTPGVLWHYAGATLSCRLRYRSTGYLMIVRDSAAVCRWVRRSAPGWHLE